MFSKAVIVIIHLKYSSDAQDLGQCKFLMALKCVYIFIKSSWQNWYIFLNSQSGFVCLFILLLFFVIHTSYICCLFVALRFPIRRTQLDLNQNTIKLFSHAFKRLISVKNCRINKLNYSFTRTQPRALMTVSHYFFYE